MNNWFRIIKA